MKILIIDDDNTKMSSICKALKEIDGINKENIVRCYSLNDARILLQEKLFDFLILDLNLPEEVGEDNVETAGLEFLEEIVSIDSYVKPIEIIILTEYPNLREEFSKLLDEINFTVLPYSIESNGWVSTIKGKVRYRLLANDSLKFIEPQHLIDVAFVTAVEIETEQLEKISENWIRKQYKNDPTYYFGTEITKGNKKLKVVRAQQSEMGMAAASLLTSKLIEHYRPRYVIMTGIAAGIGDGKDFGDIIIPSIVWNYSSGKYIIGNDDIPQFIPAPSSFTLNSDINELIKLDYKNTLDKIMRSYPDYSKVDKKLKLIIGPMACGSAVVADKSIVESLVKNHNRKTVGLDMESYGLFYAVEYCANIKPKAICIKSICDFADTAKGDNYQEYAAYTSAWFAFHLIGVLFS